jgi:hypothetical protein
MSDELTIDIPPQELADFSALRSMLLRQRDLHREILGLQLLELTNDPNLRLNVLTYRTTEIKPDPIDVIEVKPAADQTSEAFLRQALSGRAAIAYADAAVGPQKIEILISRAGDQITWRGKISTFGGPKDTGMRPGEGLAIVQDDNFAQYVAKFQNLFLDQNRGPLGRNLNPGEFYVAARWDYQLTPRENLIDWPITVINPLTGKSTQAVAVDWGPANWTHRVADLSPGLANHLGLDTDEEAILTLGLPAGHAVGPVPPGPPAAVQLLAESDIRQRFGNPDPPAVMEKGDGSFHINNQEFLNNFVRVIVPQLARLGVSADGSIECHQLTATDLQEAFADVEAHGLLDRILTWDGCWVPRHINWNPKNDFSTHTWGIAFDINARWNGYGVQPPSEGAYGSVRELVKIFEEHGFYWGGRFRTPDGMHFQYGRA